MPIAVFRKFSITFSKIISRLEVAMERIEFLEKKIKDQSEEHNDDSQRLMEIIGNSKEIFKNLFDGKDKDADTSTKVSEPDTVTVNWKTRFSLNKIFIALFVFLIYLKNL